MVKDWHIITMPILLTSESSATSTTMNYNISDNFFHWTSKKPRWKIIGYGLKISWTSSSLSSDKFWEYEHVFPEESPSDVSLSIRVSQDVSPSFDESVLNCSVKWAGESCFWGGEIHTSGLTFVSWGNSWHTGEPSDAVGSSPQSIPETDVARLC